MAALALIKTEHLLMSCHSGGLVTTLRQEKKKKKVGVFVFLFPFFWPLHMNNDLFQAIERLFRRSGKTASTASQLVVWWALMIR